MGKFGLTAIKKNEKNQTHYMTKKLFCQLNHEYLPNTVNCRRFWLKVLSPASLRKLQNLRKKILKLSQQNWEKRQKTELSNLNCSIIFKFIFIQYFLFTT
jgi:hypothetical protein